MGMNCGPFTGLLIRSRERKYRWGVPRKARNQFHDSHSPADVSKAHAGRTIAVVGDTYRFLAMGEDTDGRYATWEAIVPPGGGPPPHIHSREEESFFVLEGEITIQVGADHFVARAGTFANMPVGSLHSFTNETNKIARMIISIAPAGLEKMFFEAGQPLAPDGTAPSPSKADIERLLSVAAKYGVEIRVPAN